MAEMARHGDLPFEYGVSDCFTMPMDCVRAMTDADPSDGKRGYKTEQGALTRLRRQGFYNVADAFASQFEEIPPVRAQRGDIGALATNGLWAGVVFVDAFAWGKDEVHGIKRVPRAAVTRAFRVP